MPRTKTWSEEDIKYLVENTGVIPDTEIAAKLNRSHNAIRKARFEWNKRNPQKAVRLKTSRRFTQNEIEDIKACLGIHPVGTIAKKFNRTESSIVTLVHRLRQKENDPYLSVRADLTHYSANQIANTINCHPRTVESWIIKGWLKASRSSNRWTVTPKQWRDFCDYYFKYHYQPQKFKHPISQDGIEWLKDL